MAFELRVGGLALLVLLTALPARAEVTRDAPIVEESAYTLRQGEWKLGLVTSSYGITDRLQVDSALLLDLAVLNAGLKYKLVDAPNFALSGTVFAGGSGLTLVGGLALAWGGLRADASFPLSERLALNLEGSWQLWYANVFNEELHKKLGLGAGRVSWFHFKGALEYVFRPRHVFFLTVASPTSWTLAIDRGGSDFDALDFAQATVGYQFSPGIFNVRLDLGVGPSLYGFGPTASLDLYWRF